MPRKALGIVRTQLSLPIPLKEWLEERALQKDRASKANKGPSVKMSHLVSDAVGFMKANEGLVEAWAGSQKVADPRRQREIRDAVTFYQGNRRLVKAYLKSHRGGRDDDA